jgi:hypothetical protein
MTHPVTVMVEEACGKEKKNNEELLDANLFSTTTKKSY